MEFCAEDLSQIVEGYVENIKLKVWRFSTHKNALIEALFSHFYKITGMG